MEMNAVTKTPETPETAETPGSAGSTMTPGTPGTLKTRTDAHARAVDQCAARWVARLTKAITKGRDETGGARGQRLTEWQDYPIKGTRWRIEVTDGHRALLRYQGRRVARTGRESCICGAVLPAQEERA